MPIKRPYSPRKLTHFQEFDYAQNTAYSLKLYTQNRLCLFGEIEASNIHLNAAGNMVLNGWNELQSKFNDIELDVCVLMPNHLHAIVFFYTHPWSRRIRQPVGAAQHNPFLHDHIVWFKTMTTNAYIQGVKEQGWQPFSGKLWQRSYHDHIIRNEYELNIQRRDILSNPAKWKIDDNPVSSVP